MTTSTWGEGSSTLCPEHTRQASSNAKIKQLIGDLKKPPPKGSGFFMPAVRSIEAEALDHLVGIGTNVNPVNVVLARAHFVGAYDAGALFMGGTILTQLFRLPALHSYFCSNIT